jgi:putative endonuclease
LRNGNTRKLIAAAGEQLAASYLQRQGYVLLDKNWHSGRFGEIDLIFRLGDLVVFVEVKTRKLPCAEQDRQLVGFEDITWRKRHKLVIAARSYLNRKRMYDAASRLDVLVVTYTSSKLIGTDVGLGGLAFTHVPGAFHDV